MSKAKGRQAIKKKAYYQAQFEVSVKNKKKRSEAEVKRIARSRERREAKAIANLDDFVVSHPQFVDYVQKYGMSMGVLHTLVRRWKRGDSKTAMLKYLRESRKRTEQLREDNAEPISDNDREDYIRAAFAESVASGLV